MMDKTTNTCALLLMRHTSVFSVENTLYKLNWLLYQLSLRVTQDRPQLTEHGSYKLRRGTFINQGGVAKLSSPVVFDDGANVADATLRLFSERMLAQDCSTLNLNLARLEGL